MCNPQDASCPEPEHPRVALGFPLLVTYLQRGRFDDLVRGSRVVAVPALNWSVARNAGSGDSPEAQASGTRPSRWRFGLQCAALPIKAQSQPSWVEPGRFLSHAEQTSEPDIFVRILPCAAEQGADRPRPPFGQSPVLRALIASCGRSRTKVGRRSDCRVSGKLP